MTHIPESNGKSKSNNTGSGANGQDNAVSKVQQHQDVVLPPPPDGGWGWVVVFASFMIHVLTDGVTYSYGVFHAEFKSYFKIDQDSPVSWITSVLLGVTYCSGPFSSFLVNKFGCQLVTIIGTLVASGSLLASVWSPTLLAMYVTAGVGTGLGFGLIYLPAIVSVTVYFEKYRSLATGIAVCGSGFGTMLFAPIISWCIEHYGGYKYTMLLLSAIMLNCIIFGIMFRPLKPSKSSECIPLKKVNNVEDSVVKNNLSLDVEKNERDRSRLSFHQIATKKDSNDSKSSEINGSNNIRLALSQPILSREPFTRASCGSGIMNRSDVFLRSSIHSVRKRSGSLTNSEENVRFRLSLRSLPNGAGHKVAEGSNSVQKDDEPDNICRKMLQMDLLRDPLFILFAVSNFCTSVGFNAPYLYIVGQAKNVGIKENIASTLISFIGVSNAVGRIVLGYVSDKTWVNRLFVYNVCLTICGSAIAVSPFCSTYVSLAIYASIFGFTAGAYVGLTSVVLVDLVGLDKLTNAFGLLLLCQGIASTLGPPFVGFLNDSTSYGLGFFFAGTMIAVSGLMLFVIPSIQRKMLKKSEQLQRADTIA